ncbi:hypothetical protein MATL_G00002870 [Megalops atlanticus]|uniref:NTR domain-containing protein n=1 Tax=Megalops atlanticus TaxID=7932 RepID=A0A9D3QEN9_MEGAT|nr:hypothetical protein MATL_G00002870 [Megalops atlanticus]
MNKGQLVRAARHERLRGQSLVMISLPVTKDMIPSFRFVAYYHVGTEVVSDSVWVDVKDTCIGTTPNALITLRLAEGAHFGHQVRVELMETEEVCSAASRKRKYRMDAIEMDPMSSRAIPFVIIPMALGQHSIEVKAAVSDSSLTDGVKKDLRVVPEGVVTINEVATVVLKPSDHGGIQVEKIDIVKLHSQVPGSPADTFVRLTGKLPSQIVEAAISGAPLGSLITQPSGEGESNMITMSSPLITTHYLDKTGQWDKVGVDRREEAIKFIQMAKVFGMAYSLISIQEDVICSALKWLVLNAQQSDGIFKEDAPVIDGEMVSLPDSMKKASEFLSRRIHTLTNPYAVAMASYALALEGKHQLPGLLRFASAGYALMALVKAKEFDQAGRVVKWLTEQGFHGGGSGSTQATLIVLQAVAQYMVEVPDLKDIDLEVSLNISGRAKPVNWNLTNENAYVTHSEKVMTLYHALPEEKVTDCKNFDLQVKIEKQPEVGDENALETYKMTIEMTYLSPERDATMSILDITMLTGFIADKKDLDRVSHKLSDRVVFRVHQMTRVGLLQPAAVTLYEYYAMGSDTDVGGKERIFLAHPSCREAIDLREGKTYLIMGESDDLIRGKDRLQYMLGGGTWIEYWPTEAECQEPAYSDTCNGITSAAEELQTFGCPT